MSAAVGAALALELGAGARLLLQRLGRAEGVGAVAAAVRAAGGPALHAVGAWQPAPAGAVAAWDLRGWGPGRFTGWDPRRGWFEEHGPVVIFLDVGAAAALSAEAPHVLSWAGGVRLPDPALVRVASSDAERAAGERLLADWAHDHPEEARAQQDRTVGADLASGRVFTWLGPRSPMEAARDQLDEGVVHLRRWS